MVCRILSGKLIEIRRKLFPIPLTDYAPLKKWACLDSATGEALAAAVRKYHLPDFLNWQPPTAFACAFARPDLRQGFPQKTP